MRMSCCVDYGAPLTTACGRTFMVCPVCDNGINDCTEQECDHDKLINGKMDTECDGCGESITLTTVDEDGVLIGDECPCGHYVTRYMPGQNPMEEE